MNFLVFAKPRIGKSPKIPRPEGVTILGGSALLASMLLLFASTAFALGLGTGSGGPELVAFWIVLAFGLLSFGVGVGLILPSAFFAMFLVLAVLYLLAGVGFFRGRFWAWALGIGLSLVGIVSSIVQNILWWRFGFGFFAVPGMLVTILILYYLTLRSVRSFFSRSATNQPDLDQVESEQTDHE